MTCKQARRLIHLQLDGELGEAERRELDDHLAGCAHCARLAAELGRLEGALREGLAAPVPQADLVAGVRQQVAPTRPARRASWRPYALAAAAVAVAAIVYAVALRPSGPQPPAVVAGGGQSLHVFTPGSKVAHTAEVGEPLEERVIAWGADESRISLRFADGARLNLSKNAVIRIGRQSVTLFKGSVHADLSATDQPFALLTPWGVVGGSGATFSLTALPAQQFARLVVIEGAVSVRSDGRDSTVEARHSVLLRPVSSKVLVL